MRTRDELNLVDSTPTPKKGAGRASACIGLLLLLISCASNVFTVPPYFVNANLVNEDYSKFSHTSDKHSHQACSACHKRVDESTTPRFPGHKACIGCHVDQFLEPRVPMCIICHSNLSGRNPPLRGFPISFKESFNAKFDHAEHNRGEAKPSAGCAACHTAALRRGVAMTIPAGIAAHNKCYPSCHSANKASGWRDISSCATCHAVSSYRRTPTTAMAFNVSFSHTDHSTRQRLICEDCHLLSEGLPQTRQVSAPRAAQHFPPAGGMSCASCHNNKRAFGEKNYDDCTRCHKGATFKFKGVR